MRMAKKYDFTYAITEVVYHEITVQATSVEEADDIAHDEMRSNKWIKEAYTKHFDLIDTDEEWRDLQE
ncbi:MAG: hypothetical protein Tp1100DCM1099271_23 [Prokaryotic dsDNA virus sp.]|nr:MAG: hypothetical protein Tp1102SUR405181_7 [Prokaryotic dsDNA virus sp.]QDP60051.1 MAG: hypothetical protein Tp1100DCM1099271_23 [Prokaryotic dsDNA virus sp.]QDP67119.1 MAG: hypothetical protein Tp1111SUR49671_39 [Prokaryotic dsDNA virus sp.]